jgi:anti-sigma-K factor RskA
MNASPNTAHDPLLPAAAERTEASMRFWRAIALAAAAVIAVMAFGAYNQPELLLNFVGLRYCG